MGLLESRSPVESFQASANTCFSASAEDLPHGNDWFPLPGYMSLQKETARRSYAGSASEKQFAFRNGTSPAMERWRPSLTDNVSLLFTSHSKRMRRLNSTAPGQIFITLEIFGARDLQDSDLQERGSEMVGTKQIFHRVKLASIVVLVVGGIAVDGLRRRHECRRLGEHRAHPGPTSGSTSNGMTLTPSNGTLRAGATLQFSAAVTGNSKSGC